MVIPDKFAHVSGTHMILLCAQCVIQVKMVNSQLVRHHYIHIIWNTFCDPVMTADSLQPPDLITVLKSNSVHLISSVSLQQTSKALHAFSGTGDVWKNNVYNILFTDTARLFRFSVLRRFINHQGICSQDTGIGGDRLRCCHAYILLIDTTGCPDAFSV